MFNIYDINYYTYKVETAIEKNTNKIRYYFDYVGDAKRTSSVHTYTVPTRTKKNGSSADNNKTISYTSRWTTSKRNMLLL